ncbi:hypothetical protein R3W88_027046 [Solanum pinnatisectum]|uniref:Disease resistance protein RGA3 n=1 Tax=Solanum pinnatisectum TaxID=50273 RepID=A0AAV9LF00_9SOLN|nr:hypothetical protein R3W88_027046 [Solanum pinnatisectum]
MADPTIGATIQVVLKKLLSLTIKELSSSRYWKKDLEMLTKNISLIQAFIHDAERRQVEDQAVELWLKRLERAAENIATYLGLQSLMVPSRKILPIRETYSVVVASNVVGTDKDVAEIKEKILNMREDVVLCTIPIVGMGGLGKTTVAKRIFNDKHIKQQFEKRIWLCLPEMPETKSFLELILESLTKKKVEVQSRDIIVQTLQDELGQKKYLLVLDDMWRNTSRGYCILVTTCIKQVASAIAVDLHMLRRLARDNCWSIFKQRAFVDGEIVEMYQGLPLAASVLGGLICNKDKHEWQAILDGNPLVAGEDDNGENSIKKILKLSYDYLSSPHLKKCFAYFAMFPKDFENKFFQLLLQYSLLLNVELDVHNNTVCKMHDLVQDLAGDILKSKLFDQKSVGAENLSQVRYFGWDSLSDQIDKINEPGRLCTLFWKSNISDDMLLSFRFLRVLNLSESGIEGLSAKISKLIYLRYLDLSNTEIEDLRNSICKLYNLQTFRVNNYFSLRKLPEEMENMISLRHILQLSLPIRYSDAN